MRVVISSGHGKYVRGASGYIDEVDQARRVVNQIAALPRPLNFEVITYHDDVSKSQNENLNRIVDFHNSQTRDLDVSVHFNANATTSSPMGCEVLYVSDSGLAVADLMVDAICISSGLKNRGPKRRSDLFFLNNTNEPAILIEVCFVDSSADVNLYNAAFFDICNAIILTLQPASDGPAPPAFPLFECAGQCSTFGGPEDDGVSPSEGLAFISEIEQQPALFLPYQPAGTTGLARRLNPFVPYVACRWDYDKTPREMLRKEMALVRDPVSGIGLQAFPADWGPHEDTGRVADLSPILASNLGLQTDDDVEVIFPYRP